jgi:hypothetical protein
MGSNIVCSSQAPVALPAPLLDQTPHTALVPVPTKPERQEQGYQRVRSSQSSTSASRTLQPSHCSTFWSMPNSAEHIEQSPMTAPLASIASPAVRELSSTLVPLPFVASVSSSGMQVPESLDMKSLHMFSYSTIVCTVVTQQSRPECSDMSAYL